MLWKLLSLLTIPALLIPSGMCFCTVSAQPCSHSNDNEQVSQRKGSHKSYSSSCGHSHTHECSGSSTQEKVAEKPQDSSQHQHPPQDHEPHCPMVLGTAQAIYGESESSTSTSSGILLLEGLPASVLIPNSSEAARKILLPTPLSGPPLYLNLLTLLI